MKERRKFNEAFKREAVRKLELRGERTVAQVAHDLDVSAKQLYAWRRQFEDTTAAARAERGETTEQEVKRLRKENRELREERTILKKATCFFAKESNR